MKVSVIFTTYNSPAWLKNVLLGFFNQSYQDFEIIIADDGSSKETFDLIESLKNSSPVPIQHVWQEDDGFQKCRIMNKAILASNGDYIIFTDGDCIPRKDFISQHVRLSEPNTYLSGGYFKLPMDISLAITEEDIINQRPFDKNWLISQGMKKTHKFMKLTAKGKWADFLNWLSPTRKTWNGHNASCYKQHILAVNGFEESMQYGGEDCEFGDRLSNYGLKSKRIRYSAVCVHLDHKRGYVTPEMLAKNLAIRKETQRNKSVRAKLGLDQYSNSNNSYS